MEKLFPKLMLLLGQKEDSFDFTSLKKTAGEPTVILTIEDNKFYRFDNSGFSVVYSDSLRKFWMIGIEYSTVPVKRGHVLPFKDDAYAGISSSDTRQIVESKIGVKAFSNTALKNMSRSKYIIDSYLFDCIFEGVGGVLQGLTVYLQN